MLRQQSVQLSLFVILLSFLLSCSSTKSGNVYAELNGNWIPVNQEMSGKEMPPAFYQKQKLEIRDSIYTLTAESVDRGVIHLSGNKLDIYSREGVNKGKHFTAIYRKEGDQLVICYNLKGDAYPEDFETRGKVLYFKSVFKRE